MLQRIFDRLTDEGGPLRVRSILAFAFTGLVGYLAVDGQLDPERVVELALVVVGYYFITRAKG